MKRRPEPRSRGLRFQLRRLANPRIIGWPLFWSSLILFLLDSTPAFLGTPLDRSSVDLAGVVASTIAGQLALFAVLLIARATCLRSTRARRHPSWTIWTFVTGSIVGYIASHALNIALSASGHSTAEPDLISSVVYQSLALSVLGIVIGSMIEYRDSIAELQAAEETLLRTREAAEHSLAHEHDDVVEQVRDVLRTTTARLPSASVPEAVALLRSTAAEVVRPLSHTLATTPPDFVPTSAPRHDPPAWRSTLAEVSGAPLIRPALMALTTLVLAARLTITSLPEGALPADAQGAGVSVDLYDMGVALSELAIIAASVWLAAWLARRVIRGVLLRLAPGRRWALVVLTIAAIAVLAQALIGLGFLLPFLPEIPSTSPAARILFAVPLLLATAAAAIVEAVAARRGQVLHSLRRANDDLSWQVARVNEELWERRYRLSAYLHGPIQSTLNAGHLRLAARDTADASGVDAESIVFDLRAMDDGLDRVVTDDGTDIGIEAELVLIRRMWEKLTDIRWCMDPAIVKQVESDQACASLCADIIGEACANAALHGHAREVEIGIERIDDRSIRLRVTSDGTLEEGAEPGLGSRKLDEATLGWDLQPTGTGVVMTADLPILSR